MNAAYRFWARGVEETLMSVSQTDFDVRETNLWTEASVNKVLLLGLDGATFSVLEPAFEAGHMPVLRKLFDCGASGILTSTVPPYTPPGWTSIFTGVNPGRHGIFGFTHGNVQRPEGLVRLDCVKVPAIWNAVNAQGSEIGVFNVPMTYPPPAVEPFCVAGMLTPEDGGETPENFTSPGTLAAGIAEVTGSYEIDVEVSYEEDWRSSAIIERLSHNLTTKRRVLEWLLDKHDTSILFAVLEAPDRLMHPFYKYIDPRCEHFSRPEAEPIRERAWRFFDEMDAVVGDLLSWAQDGYVITMSDHGFGPKEKVVSVNLAMRDWGLLSIGGAGAMGQSVGLHRLARRVKKAIPKRIWRSVKGAAHSQIDWSRTKAFSSPNPQQGIYVNLEGREPHGTVPQSNYDAVREEVVARFSELTDPDDGRPVLDRIYRREEVMDGPEAARAPDLFPVCRAYAYELSDGLFSPPVITDHRQLPRGFHHLDGIFGVAGPGIGPQKGLRANVYDIMPTALYLAGLKIPEGLDGRVLREALPQDMVSSRPPRIEPMTLPLAGQGNHARPYTEQEEKQVEASLRSLGYL
jgi:predicted AlkP superfamily phosphohydrolase/phosphomutase